MEQFRYTVTTVAGKQIKGVLEANNKKEAKAAALEFAAKRRLTFQSIDKKATFLYKAQKSGQEPTTGELQAFSKTEVQAALEKLGFRVLSVNKKLLDFKGKVPSSEVSSWIRLCADLLKENLPYDEILTLLGEDTPNKRLKETIKQIQQDLKEGKEGKEVFGKHEDVFGKFPAYMLAVASTSGNMRSVYESTAKFMARDEEFKRNLRKTLVSPFVTLGVIFLVVAYYVMVIFPETATMFEKFGKPLPPMTAKTMAFSNFLSNNWMIIVAAILIPVIGLIIYTRTEQGKLWKDKVVIRIPVIGELLHKTSIEIFARVFYSLYSGSGQNIEVIKIASEACRNNYIAYQMNNVGIPMMLGEGKGIVEAMEATGVFTKTAISRFRSGAESGALRNNALQLANYYETETGYRMDRVVGAINGVVTMVIMTVMIGLTVVSSETSVM
ncbi:MAG: type II secretion system F family protein [Candidatus Marinimicrobia bacterium]|nr:type II secretion system F family protein [Candidatus Neomarinimicrobiota bacterium]MCF7850411.1 type II secretion system F family protein [Candidatus Neomarinimicrobiota bacterium]MCF7905006.1 type II secretion system F family protein [Candidatus Neomarinimicrobiota bacterium]